MDRKFLTIMRNEPVTHDTRFMELAGDCREITKPGQFLNIRLDGCFLRRPISIYDWTEDRVSILYKVVGKGTRQMADMHPGETLDVLLPLGNGFCTDLHGRKPVLIGGGIGMPPMYGVAKALRRDFPDLPVQVILGFNTAEDILPTEAFRKLDVEPVITTADGSAGMKGFVTDALEQTEQDYVFACGPEPMLRAVWPLAEDGQFSFEERMGCGFGACMGCSCRTKYGTKRICKDGPVLMREEIIW